MKSFWRAQAEPLVRKVLEETRGLSEREIRQALGRAYPATWKGEYSAEAWRAEIKSQWRRAPQPAEPSLLEERES